MLKAGDGLTLNFDGTQAEISLSRPDWFVAKITGTVSGSSPVKHTWIKQQLKTTGTYENSNPIVEGTASSNPAYLPGGGTQSNGLVFLRQRGVNSSGITEYEILAGSSSSGGNAYIEVVTDVTCTPTGIEVSTVGLAGADYDTAVIRQFLALTDVGVKSYLGQQGRAVVVNPSATGLEFGPIVDDLADSFISLSDTPMEYGTKNTYKVLTVSSSNAGISFSDNDVTTEHSITGGGNPNNPSSWVTLKLKGDTENPGKSRYYGTNAANEQGWHVLPDLTTLESKVTTLESKVTTLQSEMGTLQATVSGHTTSISNLQTTVGQHTTSIANLESSVTNLQTLTSTHTTQISGLDVRLSAIENAPYATESYVTSAVAAEASLRQAADTALDGRVTALEVTTANHTTNITALQADVSALQTSVTTLQTTVTTLQATVSGHGSDIASLQSTVSSHTTSISALDSSVTSLQGTVSSHTSSISSLQTTVNGHTTDIANLQTSLATETTNRTSADNALDGRINTLEGQNLNSRLTTAEGNITTLQGEMTTAESAIATLQGDVTGLDGRLTTAEGDITGLDGRISTLEGQTLDARISTLESQTLDTRIATLEAQNLDSRLTTAEGSIVTLQGDVGTLQSQMTTAQGDITGIDTRVITLEGQNLDTRLTTLENYDLDTRVTTLESQTLDARLTTLENADLDTRVTALENADLDTRVTTLEGYVTSSSLTLGGVQVVGTQQAAVSDAVGATIDDTSLTDCASTTQAAVDDLKTQLNALLAALRTHGLIGT